ncbi:MAG TPA: AraC family transcriptional regulator [Devosia sp.]
MFRPNMVSVTEGFSVVGDLKYRSWNGLLADVWNVEARRGAVGEYLSEHPRLFVVIKETHAGAIGIGTSPAAALDDRQAPISFIPAGMPTWSHMIHDASLSHLDLHFDTASLLTRFTGDLLAPQLQTPRLMFSDERVLSLSRLLAAECMKPGLHDLYGDSLALALFIELFHIEAEKVKSGSKLASRHLRHAVDFIEDNCLRPIKLQELADLVGLSQSYFCSAFKASTGMGPHQWQMRARVERAKARLLLPGASLARVADATGFADQAHMTRVFKQFAGTTPAAWVRTQANGL